MPWRVLTNCIGRRGGAQPSVGPRALPPVRGGLAWPRGPSVAAARAALPAVAALGCSVSSSVGETVLAVKTSIVINAHQVQSI